MSACWPDLSNFFKFLWWFCGWKKFLPFWHPHVGRPCFPTGIELFKGLAVVEGFLGLRRVERIQVRALFEVRIADLGIERQDIEAGGGGGRNVQFESNDSPKSHSIPGEPGTRTFLWTTRRPKRPPFVATESPSAANPSRQRPSGEGTFPRRLSVDAAPPGATESTTWIDGPEREVAPPNLTKKQPAINQS